jgi:hypothetical protein
MKAKKNDNIDISKINVVTTSLLLNFVNTERRFKLLEQIFKNPLKVV